MHYDIRGEKGADERSVDARGSYRILCSRMIVEVDGGWREEPIFLTLGT